MRRNDPHPPASRRRDLAVFALAWLAYLPMLGRGFASEDFVILRRLTEGGLAQNLLAQFTGTWLRLAGVGFYRPVSTALLGLEIAGFGRTAWPYLLVHGGVHALNAVLVARLTEALLGPRARHAAGFAGLLFALYPLSLNAVAFVASFATLFGVTFSLLALLAWVRWRQAGGGRWLVAAFGSFVLALGSYELSAVVPGLVVVVELFAPGLPPASWASRFRAGLGWAVVLGLYFGWRRSLFGAVLGGYPETASLITRLDPRVRLPEAGRALAYLLVPAEVETISVLAGGLLAVIACLGPPLIALLRREGHRWEAARVAALGLSWALAGLAPFGVTRLVPANGRYGYLAVVGCLLALAGAAESLESSFGRLSSLAFRSALLVGCAGLFVGLERVNLRSAEIVAAARADLAAKAGAGPLPILCADYPLFVRGPGGTPLAQVFHYGLSDSVQPPFGPLTGEVLPLTPGIVSDAAPLLRVLPGARLLRWSPDSSRFLLADGELEASSVSVVDVGGLAPGSSWPQPPSSTGWRVTLPPEGARCEIVVAAPGNAARFSGRRAGAACIGELPRDFLDTQARLYGGRAYWWIEVISGSGATVAASTARSLELGSGARRAVS